MHDQRNVWVGFGGGLNQMLDKRLTRVFACASTGLQDDGRAHGVGSHHHGLHLFQVVDVESWNAVTVLCSVVQKFAHRYECHGEILKNLKLM